MGYIAIPKALMGSTYSAISPAAKLLYGRLSDRSSLSKSNGDAWKTPSGEIFCYYPISKICETMGCGHDKARRLLRELVDAGLIRRIRQGQGKPDKLIVTSALQSQESKLSKSRKLSTQDSDSSAPNNPEPINPDSINPDQPLSLNRNVLETMIHENISYDILVSEIEKSFVETAVNVMVDTIQNPTSVIKIAGIERNKSEIYRRLMGLNDMHVRYAFDRFKATTKEIQYPQAYVLARLYNAPDEMDIYYESKVAADERREWRKRYGE